MSIRAHFVGVAAFLLMVACNAATTVESARAVAQQKLTALLVSEKMQTSKVALIREEKFTQGWFFEYQVTFGVKSELFTVLVDDKGNAEISREGNQK